MKTTTDDFVRQIMLLPKKPQYIGFTMTSEEIYKGCLAVFNELCGRDMSEYCGLDFNEESFEAYFYINTDDIQEELGEEEYHRLNEKLLFDMDDYYAAIETLSPKWLGVESWVFIQGRPYDAFFCDVQIGLPMDL